MTIILKDGLRFTGSPGLNARKVTRLVHDGIWTETDLEKHGLVNAVSFEVPEGKITVGDESFFEEDGIWYQHFETEDIPPPTTEQIDVERERRIANGAPITLSTEKSFTVQTRDAIDFRNISGASSVGMARQMLANTSVIEFRDADNGLQELTPAEAIEMGLHVAAFVSYHYESAWALKDMDPIPDDYNDDSYWP